MMSNEVLLAGYLSNYSGRFVTLAKLNIFLSEQYVKVICTISTAKMNSLTWNMPWSIVMRRIPSFLTFLDNLHRTITLSICFSGWQVEWIQQQVVKRRIKRDYKPGGTQSTYFNDPKWPSMWYMVSTYRVIDSVSC